MERRNTDPILRLERAASALLLEFCWQKEVFIGGMGSLLVSRELPNGVAFATFLLDAYCLGVKDSSYGVTSRPDYEWRIRSGIEKSHPLIDVAPRFARKPVEKLVAYAQSLGFSPAPEYTRARLTFGEIDAAACRERFTFGKDGKPCYVAGPYDNTARQERILATLRARCGSDGYHYMIPIAGDRLGVRSDGNLVDLLEFED